MTPRSTFTTAIIALVWANLSCSSWIALPPNLAEGASGAARVEAAHAATRTQTLHQDAHHLSYMLTRHIPDLSPKQAAVVARTIVDAADRHELDPLLISAVVWVESMYRPQAVSYAGAVGMMQILPYVGKALAKRHGVTWDGWRTLEQPRVNIALGTAYLAELRQMFAGDLELALAAYNMGPTLLKSRLARGWRPNGPYVRAVLDRYRRLVRHEQSTIAWREDGTRPGIGVLDG